jgi:hypothetical protein
MKKLLAAVAMSLSASTAMATISFDYGTIWNQVQFDPNGSSTYNWVGQGQFFSVNWDLESDVVLGFYGENSDYNNGYGDTYPFVINALNVSKGVMKNASVGLHLGNIYDDYNDSTGMLTDIFGTVTILGGTADKISGSLKASFGGRFADTDWNAGGERWNGYFVNVAVGIGI